MNIISNDIAEEIGMVVEPTMKTATGFGGHPIRSEGKNNVIITLGRKMISITMYILCIQNENLLLGFPEFWQVNITSFDKRHGRISIDGDYQCWPG